MAMPISDDEGITIREVGRNLADFRHEMRSALSQMVRADVYRAEQQADRTRIENVEKALARMDEDRSATRRQTNGAIVAAIGSGVVAVLMLILTLALK